jgi:hypothetical protein
MNGLYNSFNLVQPAWSLSGYRRDSTSLKRSGRPPEDRHPGESLQLAVERCNFNSIEDQDFGRMSGEFYPVLGTDGSHVVWFIGEFRSIRTD